MQRRLLLFAAAAALISTLTVSAAPGRSHVAFRSSDGVTLRGRLWAGGPTAVVFSHMYLRNQSSWFDLADRLAAQGHTVLTFDFRGVGASSGRFVIANVYRDTLAAVQFVRKRNPNKIVLIGASMGGTSSIVAAGHTDVDGLVIIASGMQFQGLNVHPYLPNLTIAKLFVVGRDDARFNRSIRTMHARTPAPKQLLVVPTGLHGTDMFRVPRHRDAIYRAIYAFLGQIAQ